jgi:hypothetical protein
MSVIHKGSVFTLQVTVPLNPMMREQINRIMKHAVKGYPYTLTEIMVEEPSYAHEREALREAQRQRIKEMALDLDILHSSRKRDLVVLRTTFVYFLLDRFSATLIGQSLNWQDHSNVIACRKRYNALKHYPDYQEASAKITRYLKLYSPVDSLQEKL